jgi:hypothetical protein
LQSYAYQVCLCNQRQIFETQEVNYMIKAQEVKQAWNAPQLSVHGSVEEMTQATCQLKKSTVGSDAFGNFEALGAPYECS